MSYLDNFYDEFGRHKRENPYLSAYNFLNPEGPNRVLIKGDILTCYEHI